MAEFPVPRPESGKESRGIPKTDGETKTEQERRARALQEELKKTRGSTERVKREVQELQFKEAQKIAEVVSRIQNGVQAREEVRVSPQELVEIREALKRHGYEIKGMPVGEMVLVARSLLKDARITGLGHASKTDREMVEEVAKQLGGGASAQFTLEEMDEYFKVAAKEDFEGLTPVYETKIKSADKELDVGVYRREDGSLVMTRLPTDKFNAQTLREMLVDSGAVDNLDLPKNFDSLLEGEKVLLLERAGVSTTQEKLDIAPPVPPALPGLPGVSGMTFKEILLERLDNLATGQANRLSVGREMLRRIHSNDPELINSAFIGLQDIRGSREHDAVLLAQLGQVLPGPLQNELAQTKEALDATYTFLIYDPVGGLSDNGRRALLKDLDDASQTILTGLRYGQRLEIDQIMEQLIQKAKEPAKKRLEPPNLRGVREWYAVKLAQDVLNVYEIIQRGEVKANPFDNIRSAEEVMRFFEKSKSVEGFNLARDRLTRLLDAVDNSRDPDLTEDDKFRMRKHIETFEIMNPIFITMHQQEGAAEQMQRAINPIDNDTVFFLFDRFSDVRDANGDSYLRYVDATGVERIANYLDESVKAFRQIYQKDNYNKNQITQMTKRNLNLGSGNQDEIWLIKNILDLPQDQPLPILSLTQISRLQRVWNASAGDDEAIGAKKAAIQQWYTEKTLMGVDGFDPDSPRELRDVREDELMNTTLRARLVGLGIDSGRVNDLLNNYELTQAVKTITANYVRFTLSSTLDRFRVYSTQDDRGEIDPLDPRGERKRLEGSLFGEETPFFMREADQITDFFYSEGHGDENVNKLIRRFVDERWRGYMIASNQLMFRIITQLKNKYLLPGGKAPTGMSARIEHEIQAELTRVRDAPGLRNLQREEVEAYVIIDMINRFNPNNPNDPTTIDLSTIDNAESSKELDSYMFTDNANDRTGAQRWSREEFKAFTFQPFKDQLFAMHDKYYSTRHKRKRQAMDFFLDVYAEAGNHWKEWLDLKYNITSVQIESTIQEAIDHNVLDKPRAEVKKTQLLGRPVIREAKQWGILIYEGIKDLLRPGSLFGGFLDFWKTLFAYLTQQK